MGSNQRTRWPEADGQARGECGLENSTPATWLAGESEGSLATDHLGPLEVAQRAPKASEAASSTKILDVR
jgi:hypothetical protein